VEGPQRRGKESHLALEVKILTHKLMRESSLTPDPPWMPWVTRLMKAFNAVVQRLPVIPGLIRKTTLNRFGRVSRLREAGKEQEALDLAVRTIQKCVSKGLGQEEDSKGIALSPFKELRDWAFWGLLLHAVQLAKTHEQRCRLVPFIEPLPVQVGLQQAQYYDSLSRWHWPKNPANAIEIAEAAIEADPSWPESYLTLAFYLLHSKLGDPLPVLADAVRADPEIWPEIEQRFGAEIASAVRAIVES
jgi:hypothetical protein